MRSSHDGFDGTSFSGIDAFMTENVQTDLGHSRKSRWWWVDL